MKWIKAFLTGRTQYVAVNSSFSNEKLVSSGVPQGSVLGPLCFLLYINDLPSVVQNSSIKLFADDSKLYFCAKTVEDLIFLCKVRAKITQMLSLKTGKLETWSCTIGDKQTCRANFTEVF